MWNPFNFLSKPSPKEKELREITVEELALKQARRLLEDHIDLLAVDFAEVYKPQFKVDQMVQVNAFGITKPGSSSWEGGATTLLKCLQTSLDESIQVQITDYRVHKGFAYEVIDWFFGESWSMIVECVLQDKKDDLIRAFDRKLDQTASHRSYLTPHKCLYLEYYFKTSSKKKAEFEPLWGLSANAFHPLDSKEAKLTRKLHKQHGKLNQARENIQKIESKIKKLQEEA